MTDIPDDIRRARDRNWHKLVDGRYDAPEMVLMVKAVADKLDAKKCGDPDAPALIVYRRSDLVVSKAVLRELIEAEIAKVESDSRINPPAATLWENGPLALIQVALKTRRDALKWVLQQMVEL